MNPRFVYVDAHRGARAEVADIGRRSGHLIECVASANEALELVERGSVDVLLVADVLPDMEVEHLIEAAHVMQPELLFTLVSSETTLLDELPDPSLNPLIFFLRAPWDEQQFVTALNEASTRARLGAEGPTDRTLRVLIVEDSEADEYLLQAYLSATGGCVLQSVTSIQGALAEIYEHGPPEVILTDLALPDCDGLDCVLRLKRAAPFAALIVLSGLDDQEVALRALRLGAQDHLVKGEFDHRLLQRSMGYALERKRSERRLHRLAHSDHLTGLENRHSFHEQLTYALRLARRHDRPFAVMFLDLDGFKGVNDAHGHDAGDQLLVEVADRLRTSLRKSDQIARLGGDEYAALLPEIRTRDGARHVASRVVAELAQPYRSSTEVLAVTASVGIALYPDDAENSAELMRSADSAMYMAKRRGGNQYVIDCSGTLTPSVAPPVERPTQDGFVAMAFYDLRTGKAAAAQCVPRLLFGGGDAGSTALCVRALGDSWAQLKDLPQAPVLALPLGGAVLEDPALVDRLRHALEDADVDTSRVQFEVSARVLVARPELQSVLDGLVTLGPRLLLDGVGFRKGPLPSLGSTAVAAVRLHGDLVAGIRSDRGLEANLVGVLAAARHLNQVVYAEGIESESQLAFLRELGCRYGGGSHFEAKGYGAHLNLVTGERARRAG